MKTADPIRRSDQLKKFLNYYRKCNELRNYALIVLGVYTALRISDLLDLRWGDVYDNARHKIKDHLVIMERKTKKNKNIALHQQAKRALKSWRRLAPDSEYIFVNTRTGAPITRTQAWRIVHRAATSLELPGTISCHSLRKTWGYYAWQNNISPVIITEVYNHSNYQITRRYLGVEQDDLDQAYLRMRML